MRAARRVTVWVGASAVVLLLAGCAEVAGGGARTSISSAPRLLSNAPVSSPGPTQPVSSSPPPTAASAVDAPLRGTTWYYTGRINNDLRLDEPVDPAAWVRFGVDSVVFNGTVQLDPYQDTACPAWTAEAVVTEDSVSLTPNGRADEEAHNVCGFRFLDAFAKSAVIVRSGRTLSVHVDQGQNQFTFLFSADRPAVPAPAAPDLSFLPAASPQTVREQLERNILRGKMFRAMSVTGRKLVGGGIGLDFGLDRAMLSTGCNGGSVGFTMAGTDITFTAGDMTAAGCSDRRVSEQESWVTSFLQGTRSFNLAGSTLTISNGAERLVMTEAVPVPASAAPSAEPTDPASGEPQIITAVDEIVDSRGPHRLAELELERGMLLSEPAMMLSATRLSFSAGCGQYVSVLRGSLPDVSASIGVGEIAHACPTTRSKLAAALRYILSGPVTIERDGAFLTFTGRDGLRVTAHNGYQHG